MPNLNIVAIGGGSLESNTELLNHGLEMTGKQTRPRVLFVPSSRTRQETYDRSLKKVRDHFDGRLGVALDVLHDFNSMPSEDEVDDKLGRADMLYMPGGNPEHMMSLLRTHGYDHKIKERVMGGLVMTGISAGAIAPFSWGWSDIQRHGVIESEAWSYIPVSALNLLPAAITPHAEQRGYNAASRLGTFENTYFSDSNPCPTTFAFGVDSYAAVVVHDDTIVAKASQPGAVVTRFDLTRQLAEPLLVGDHMKLDELSVAA